VIDPTATLNGASGASTPTTIYDGGPRTVLSIGVVPTLSPGTPASTVIAAAAGLRTKVISFRISCSTFTTAGNVFIKDGAGGTTVGFPGYISALSQVAELQACGFVVFQTSVNTLLEIFFGGNGQLTCHVVYYQAP
jgi:hypothetical protein